MKGNLASIIFASIFTLALQTNAQTRHFSYDFNAFYLWDKISLLTGKFYYCNNSKEIQARIDSLKICRAGELIKSKLENFKEATYRALLSKDSIFYIEEIKGKSRIERKLSKESLYLDALSSAQTLLEYIEKDSVEYHKLLKEGSIEVLIQDSLRSIKLVSFRDRIVKYRERKVKAKELSVEGCPDNKTLFSLIIYQGKVIQILGSSRDYPGVRVKADLKESYIEE